MLEFCVALFVSFRFYLYIHCTHSHMYTACLCIHIYRYMTIFCVCVCSRTLLMSWAYSLVEFCYFRKLDVLLSAAACKNVCHA